MADSRGEVLCILWILFLFLHAHAIQFLSYFFCLVTNVDRDGGFSTVRLMLYTKRDVLAFKFGTLFWHTHLIRYKLVLWFVSPIMMVLTLICLVHFYCCRSYFEKTFPKTLFITWKLRDNLLHRFAIIYTVQLLYLCIRVNFWRHFKYWRFDFCKALLVDLLHHGHQFWLRHCAVLMSRVMSIGCCGIVVKNLPGLLL